LIAIGSITCEGFSDAVGEHHARLATIVDREHLAQIRDHPATYAPGGVEHLILEVLAYAADEAESTDRAGRGIVTLHPDGSVSVADDGRGNDTRVDAEGRVIKKPVMGTKDLRFLRRPRC